MEAPAITTIQGSKDDLVDLASIERELARMWRSVSERGKVAITRACRSNLVVLAEGESPEFVEEVTVRHPARLIAVLRSVAADGEGSPPIRAQVSALCHLREAGGFVCSERIALTVKEGAENRVASVVSGLAVGGLPIAVIGQPAAVERYAGAGLLELADRILVDTTGAAPNVWTRLLGPAALERRLTDLAWTRLAEFRRAVARAIVRSPMRRAVDRLEAVDIAHARGFTPALLLAAWLGHRLRWGRPRRRRLMDGPVAAGAAEDLRVFEVRARGRRLRLRLGEAREPEGLVLLLRAPEIELRVALAAEESVVTVALGAGRVRLRSGGRPGIRRGGSRAQERVELKIPQPADLIVQALEHPGLCDVDASPVLARAMELAAELSKDKEDRDRDLDL